MLDDQVTKHLAACLLTPERTEKPVAALIKRRDDRKADHGKRASALRDNRDEAQGKLTPLDEAIGNGIADLSDPALKARFRSEK